MTRDFLSGLTFWWRGWAHILSHRRLLLLALTPIAICMFLVIATTVLILKNLAPLTQAMTDLLVSNQDSVWHDLVYYPLTVGGGIGAFFVGICVAFALHTLIATPFYSLLADRTLRHLGKRPPDLGWLTTLRLLRSGALKSLLLLFAGALVFTLSLVPVVDLIAFATAMLILAFEQMDYAFDGMGFTPARRLDYLRRERAQWAGMAFGMALTLLLPGLTLLVTPGAVVGSALILKD